MATQGCLNGGAGGLAQGFFYPHMVWELFWGLLGFLWGPTFSESAFKMLFPQPLHSPKAVTVFYTADVAQEIHTWPGERVDSCNSIIYVNKIVATMVGRWGHILGGACLPAQPPRATFAGAGPAGPSEMLLERFGWGWGPSPNKCTRVWGFWQFGDKFLWRPRARPWIDFVRPNR